MNLWRATSIESRLIRLILLAGTLTLLCVMVGVMVYESTSFQPRALAQLRQPADILKELLQPALDFDAREDAHRYLKIYCENQTNPLVAVVYDAKGKLFASYPSNLATAPPSPAAPSYKFSDGTLVIWEQLERHNQRLGHLYLREQLPPLYVRLAQYSLMLGTLLTALVILGSALLLGTRRDILRPLAELVKTTVHIAQYNDFSVRSNLQQNDEVGHLAHTFNHMLDVISTSDASLRQSEEQLRLSTELGKVAVWEYNVVTNEMSRSANHDALYGINGQGIWHAETFLDATHPDDRELSNQIIQKSLIPGGSDEYAFDFRVFRPDGVMVWLNVIGQIVKRDATGQGLLIRGCLSDITQRKLAATQLIESEQRYRALFENMSAGFVLGEVVQDEQGKPVDMIILAANQGIEASTGLKQTQVMGQRLTQILPGIEKDTTDWIGIYGQVALTGVPQQLEQGSELLGFIYAITVYQAGPKQCAIIFTDVTERKRAVMALKANEARLNNILQTSIDGFWRANWQGRILEVNLAYCQMSGYSEQELLTLTIPDLEAAESAVETKAHLVKIKSLGKDQFESRHRRKDGSVFDVEISVQCNYGSDDEMVVFIRDVTERKRAQTTLLEKEALKRGVLNSVLAHIAVLDQAGTILEVNDAWRQFATTNSGTDEALRLRTEVGINYLEICSKSKGAFSDEAMLAHDGLLAVLRGEKAEFSLEYPCHCLDEERWFVMSATALKTKAGGAVVSHINITELKLTEAALRESEELFATLFRSSPAGNVLQTLDGRYVKVNDVFCSMLGYTDEEMIGQTAEGLGIATKAVRENALLELERHGSPTHYPEVRLSCHDGSFIDVLFSSVVLTLNGIPHRLGTSINITERKRAEELLRRSQAELKAITDHAPATVALVDLDSKLRYMNHAPEGIDTADLIGLSIFDTAPPGYEAVIRAAHEKVCATQQPETFRVKFQTGNLPDDNYNILEAHTGPVFVGGEMVGVVHVAIDVTEQVFLTEKLHQLNQELEARVDQRTAELEASNQELEAFNYSVSHDLRAPLRHVAGFIELLKRQGFANADQKSQHYMQVISASALQMGRMVDDILTFSRLGRTAMRMTHVNLNKLVNVAQTLLQPEMEGREIRWNIKPLPSVEGDREMLQRVITNLIGNALKYSKPKALSVIEITSQTQGNEYIFCIKDNGVGFDMRFVDKLFGVFQRLHRTEEFEGTGIGLANVQRIIQRHGGRVWAQGKVDEGASFYFSLPIVQAIPLPHSR